MNLGIMQSNELQHSSISWSGTNVGPSTAHCSSVVIWLESGWLHG